MSIYDPKILKICVEKPLDVKYSIENIFEIKKRNNKVYSNDQVLQNIRNGDKNSANKLRAAFIKNKLWNQGSFINIFFLEDGSNVPRTSLENFKKEKDIYGNPLKIDPLQLIIDNYSVKDAVKKIVNERINPIVNLKFKFVDDINSSDIRISFNSEDGAWSFVGTDSIVEKKAATMNL